MILFLCLMIMALVVGVAVVLTIGVTGGIGAILFAEPIICIILIGWLISILFKK